MYVLLHQAKLIEAIVIKICYSIFLSVMIVGWNTIKFTGSIKLVEHFYLEPNEARHGEQMLYAGDVNV